MANKKHYVGRAKSLAKTFNKIANKKQTTKNIQEYGLGGTLGGILGSGLGMGLTALTGGAAAPLTPMLSKLGSGIGGGIDQNNQQKDQQELQEQYMQQQQEIQRQANIQQTASNNMTSQQGAINPYQPTFAYGGVYDPSDNPGNKPAKKTYETVSTDSWVDIAPVNLNAYFQRRGVKDFNINNFKTPEEFDKYQRDYYKIGESAPVSHRILQENGKTRYQLNQGKEKGDQWVENPNTKELEKQGVNKLLYPTYAYGGMLNNMLGNNNLIPYIGQIPGLMTSGIFNMINQNKQSNLINNNPILKKQQELNGIGERGNFEDNLWFNNSMDQFNNSGYYATGGMMQQPNSELERGEAYRLPNGDLKKISMTAPTHAEGGVKMNLPNGTEILGKNKIKGSNKTFKELGRKLSNKYNTYSNSYEKATNPMDRNTGKLMIDKIDKDFSKLFDTQQSQKKYKCGGKTKKYEGGDIVDNINNLFIQPNNTQVPFANTQSLPGQIDSGMGTGLSQNYGSNLDMGGLNRAQNANTEMINGAGNGFDWGQASNIAGNIGMYAPAAFNLAKGLFSKPTKLDKIEPPKYRNPYEQQAISMMPTRFDISDELESNRLASATSRNALRQSGANAGMYGGALRASNIDRMRANAGAYTRKGNIESQMRQQKAGMMANLGAQQGQNDLRSNMFATQYNREITDANMRSKAARNQFFNQGLTDVQQAIQMNRLMKGQQGADNVRVATINDLITNYGLSYEQVQAIMAGGQNNNGSLFNFKN